MARLLRRLWDQEIGAVVADISPVGAFALILAAAALINKRYLGDSYFGGDANQRWLAAGGWLAACAALILCRRASRSRLLGATLGGLLGLELITVALAATKLVGGKQMPPEWVNPIGPDWMMLLLAWLPVVIAAGTLPADRARPALGVTLALLGLALVVVVLLPHGPGRPLLHDSRYDKFNWCLLTGLWLLAAPAALGYGLLGGGRREEGVGLGRWRFWLPLVALFLPFMIALITGYAGRQQEFLDYYPMYRRDWYGYDPASSGWAFFVSFELAYGVYFLAWEYFFRGWMLFRLGEIYGPAAIGIQAVPFVLMHIGKPGVEAHSSLIAGLVLGWLAWRSRSFWPCFLLHWGAAATMDVVAVLARMGPAPGAVG